MTNIEHSIEAILFTTAQPASFSDLAQRLNISVEEVKDKVAILKARFENHGLMIVVHNDSVDLVTRPEQSALIEAMRKEELSKELSKASAETLAIVIYAPGISKAQIEYIRGVNVSYTLRSLIMRGLIESKGVGRAVVYHPTIELLHSYGVERVEDLPDYIQTKEKIESLLATEETL